MLELTSAGRPVRLAQGASVQLEYHSPLFDEDYIKGEFSYSFPVPAEGNGPLYGYPERLDRLGEPGGPLPAELADDGLPLLVGSQRVTAASARQYTISLQNGLSGANLSGRLLSSFAYGGLREVPRYVQQGLTGGGAPQLVPGLVLHANEVAADFASYDYVFAPLRNEYQATTPLATPDPLAYPPASVNAWYVYPVPLFGIPAGGSFLYAVNFQVPGSALNAPFRELPPYCPFPRLRYVLRVICEESGLVVDEAQLLPGELGELVLVGNAQLIDRGTPEVLRFSLADVVPGLTVAELLAALRQDLGIVLYQDPATRRMRTVQLGDQVTPLAPAADLTALRAGLPAVAIDASPAGVTLTYGIDSADELTKDALSKQPDPALVLPAVATVADLPAVADLADNPQAGQVRLVEAENRYYSCCLTYRDPVSVTLTWLASVPALASIAVNGGGSDQAQKICYTSALSTVIDLSNTVQAPLPAISQPFYLASEPKAARSAALRLLFYNGLRPASDGVSLYPQLSALSASGRLSTELGGEAGTYRQLLSAWLQVKLRAAAYTQPLLLTPLALARLDLSGPLLLDGVRVLPRKLTVTVPLRKAAALEVVRV